MEVASHRHTTEEALQLAGMQGLQLVLSGCTGALAASWWFGDAMDFRIPQAGPLLWAIGGIGAWMLWHLIDRDRID
jgi:hypothetical protein